MVVIGSAGVLAPGRWRWARSLGWMAALTVSLVVAFNAAASAALWLIDSNVQPAAGSKLVAAVAGLMVMGLVYWLAVRFGERRAVGELGLRRAPGELLLGLAVGSGLIAVIIGILWTFGWVAVEPRAAEGITLALRDSLRSGVFEELILRLVILRLLWRAFGIWPAIALSALLFGALHLANPDSSLFAAACLIVGEGILIGLFLITGRLWTPIGVHAAWNFTQGWLFGAAVSGTGDIAGGPLATRPAAGVPALLSGGGFGPEASVAALGVSLAASAALLLQAWRRGDFIAADQPSLNSPTSL